MVFRVALIALGAMAFWTPPAPGLPLHGEHIEVDLAVSESGVPYVSAIAWRGRDDGLIVSADEGRSLSDWVPAGLVDGAKVDSRPAWSAVDNRHYDAAEAQLALDNGLKVTWRAQVFKGGDVLELRLRLNNTRHTTRQVEWFPAWTYDWTADSEVDAIRYWDALDYTSHDLAEGSATLGARLHSSDRQDGAGHVPFWRLQTDRETAFFSLAWSGGWQARLKAGGQSVHGAVTLPPDETQLELGPGAIVEGPALTVTFVPVTDGPRARAAWMRQRDTLVEQRYNTKVSYPFIYNPWYATSFDVKEDFLRAQAAALDAYGFDTFVVDAGWYNAIGDWRPDPEKFPEDAFTGILDAARRNGADVGLWTAPQYAAAGEGDTPASADAPGLYDDSIDAYLKDLASAEFTKELTGHVTTLRERYGLAWWKYDRPWFAPATRQGVMRNVLAFQNALRAVRRAQPDLTIENSQRGGRMLNEFTFRMAQSHWLRDGGGTGRDHARANIAVALRALEFVPPYGAARWTNNVQEHMDKPPEFILYYARSAMAGVWGISADLPYISVKHTDLLAKEAERYRRLNRYKASHHYAIQTPKPDAPVAGITYIGPGGVGAAVLLFRWDAEDAFDVELDVTRLDSRVRYRVEDVDTGDRLRYKPGELHRDGLTVHFGEDRQSALIFVDPVDRNRRTLR